MDGQADMTMLIVTVRNFANTPKNAHIEAVTRSCNAGF
jgi:hypothetical protein